MDARAQQRLPVLAHVLAGELAVIDAAANLGLLTRQVKRLADRLRSEGAAVLVHGNRGGRPANRVDDASTTPGGSGGTARSAGPMAISPCRGGGTGRAGRADRSSSRSASTTACGSATRTSASRAGPRRRTPGGSGRAGPDHPRTGIRQLASRNGLTPARRQPRSYPAGSSADQVRIIPGAAVGAEAMQNRWPLGGQDRCPETPPGRANCAAPASRPAATDMVWQRLEDAQTSSASHASAVPELVEATLVRNIRIA